MKKLLLLFVLIWSTSQAKISLPSMLSDNMVLQQESTAMIWGWTTANSEKVTLKASWTEESLSTMAYQGKWSIQIPTSKAVIVGQQVHVFSSKVRMPLVVRFAFSNNSVLYLYNKEGLPAFAFRTDDWERK